MIEVHEPIVLIWLAVIVINLVSLADTMRTRRKIQRIVDGA